MAVDIRNDPKFKDFVSRAQSIFGLDPNQQIDVNDPMTKLTMAIVLTTLEQGRDNYSYDQYVKGIAKSIGIDPAEFDSEVNQTTMGFENNSGNTDYVSPATPAVSKGSSTVPQVNVSGYINVGIAASLPAMNNIVAGSGLTSYISSQFSGTSTGVISSSGTPTGTIVPSGVSVNTSGNNIAILSTGTNSFSSDPGALRAQIDQTVKGLQAQGYQVVMVMPKPEVNGTTTAYDAAKAVGDQYGLTQVNPIYPAGNGFHPTSYQAVVQQISEATGVPIDQLKKSNVPVLGDSIGQGVGQALGTSNNFGITGQSSAQILSRVSQVPAAPEVASTVTSATPNAVQQAADQSYFVRAGGGNAGDNVTINGHTYKVQDDGKSLTPVASSVTWDANTKPPLNIGPPGTVAWAQSGDKTQWVPIDKNGQSITTGAIVPITSAATVTASNLSPLPPPNFDGANTVVTQNRDVNGALVSVTYVRTNTDGTKTTIIQSSNGTPYGKLVDTDGKTVAPEPSIIPPGWENSKTTTVPNADANGNIINYTLTNNDTGQQIVYTPGSNGVAASYIDVQTGKTIPPSAFNNSIIASDLSAPSAQSLTMNNIPSNEKAGVPDNWIKQTSISTGPDGFTQVVSVKYVDPNNETNFKAIGPDGSISNANGSLGQNYFNGSNQITTIPSGDAAGVPGFNAQPIFNNNGTLLSVVYVNPEDSNDRRYLNTVTGKITDQNGTDKGIVGSMGPTTKMSFEDYQNYTASDPNPVPYEVASSTTYNFIPASPIVETTNSLQQVQPSAAGTTIPMSVASTSNNITTDLTIQQLQDRKGEIANTLALNNITQTGLLNDIKESTNRAATDTSLTIEQKNQLTDYAQEQANQYESIKKQQETLVNESNLISEKLSNPTKTVVNTEEQATLQNSTNQQLQDVKDKVSNNNAVLQDLYQEKENINNEIAFYDKQISEGKMSEAAAAEPKAVLEERLINTGAAIGLASDKGTELLSQQIEIQAQVEQNNQTLNLVTTPVDATQPEIQSQSLNQYSFANNMQGSAPLIVDNPTLAQQEQLNREFAAAASPTAGYETSFYVGTGTPAAQGPTVAEAGFAMGSSQAAGYDLSLNGANNPSAVIGSNNPLSVGTFNGTTQDFLTSPNASQAAGYIPENTNTLDTTGQPLYQSQETGQSATMFNTPLTTDTASLGVSTPATTTSVSEFYSTVDTMPSGGRGVGNTILESSNERAAYQAEQAAQPTATPVNGGSSAAGSSSPSAPGGMPAAGSAAGAMPGGC